MIGHTVGSYKITEKIGEGGMGAVFKGIDVMLDREVAIKMLRPELARQAQLAERFRSEAVTLARLNHPNIATLYSFLRQNDDYFMVMEYVRGETLEQLMRQRGPMNCETAVKLFCHALEGMEHAHGMNIIHRDIKPANIMLTERGSIKVMDFGIARVLGTDRMTRTGHLVGTIEYMPPEQVRGGETDARSDIYSLGILLYEMLTGRVPFTSPSEYDLMRAQVEDAPPPPREFAPQTPVEIEQSILRALAKNKDDRFQTAGEFRLALLSGNNAPARSVSATQVAPNQATQSQHVKETRLAAGGAAIPVAAIPGTAIPVAQMKATRLAPQNQPQPLYATAPPTPNQAGYQSPTQPTMAPSASFLGRLNWKHYAGAGIGLFVFVALLVGAPLGLFLSTRSGTVQPAKEEVTPTPAPKPSAIPTVAPAYVIPPQPSNSQPPQTEGGDYGDNGSSSGSRSAKAAPKRKPAPPPSRAEVRPPPPPKPVPTPPPSSAKKEEEKKEKKRGFFGKLKDKVPGIKLP